MKRLLGIALGIAGALAVSTNASAASFSLNDCSSGTISNPCNVGTVTTSYSGGVETVTFTASSGFGFGTGSNDLIAFDLGTTDTAVNLASYTFTSPDALTFFAPSGTMDGFGTFSFGGSDSGCTTSALGANSCTSLTFTIAGPGITSDTSLGLFAAHFTTVGQSPAITGFVESTPTSGGSSNGGAAVPEPASLMLLGSGLALAAARFRKKRA